MKRRGGPAGFSLPEVLISVSIVALVMATSVVNLRTQEVGSQARGLATVVCAELRLARQNALTGHSPVAVIIPSGNKAVPYSQSLYIASGDSEAHISKVANYSHDFSQAVLFEGSWPLSGGQTVTGSPPVFGSRASSFVPSQWLSANMRNDYCIIFTQDGNVVSNGLPFYNGAYHLVAAVGAQYGTGSLPNSPSGAPLASRRARCPSRGPSRSASRVRSRSLQGSTARTAQSASRPAPWLSTPHRPTLPPCKRSGRAIPACRT